MLSLLATSLLAFLPQTQNEIVLTDGKVLPVDKIVSETFTSVTFKRGSSEGRKASEEVLEVHHELGNSRLDDYAYAVEAMNSHNYVAAVGAFREVLADESLHSRKTYNWVKQHALWREIRCLNSLADFKSVSERVDVLLTEVPDSFFYAPALLIKAQSKADGGDAAGAIVVFKKLEADVDAKGLPERWRREVELGLLLLDPSKSGADKQMALQGLAERNLSDFPTVASRAQVEVGNAMVEAGDFKNARAFFRKIMDDGNGGEAILAAALSGLGDCAYLTALALDSPKEQAPHFEEAILDFLTVASVYREEVRLVPRAMYFAGDSLKRLGDFGSARNVASRIRQLYPDSSWKKRLFAELGLK